MNEIEEPDSIFDVLLKEHLDELDKEGEEENEEIKPHRSRQGAENERALLNYLRQKYPDIEFQWLADSQKSVFDIYCKYCLFDMVGIDKSLRLITDHKKRLKEHVREAKERSIPGYIAFKFKDTFYFLSVESSYFKKWKRVPINDKILAACVQPPIPIEQPIEKRKIAPIITHKYERLTFPPGKRRILIPPHCWHEWDLLPEAPEGYHIVVEWDKKVWCLVALLVPDNLTTLSRHFR